MIVDRRIFDRRCRITVAGTAVAATPEAGRGVGLRVGFTVDKKLGAKEPNSAEVSIYNLARSSRNRLATLDRVPVVIEAGYKNSGMSILFAGQMREAYSRPEPDGSWVTILRAGDADVQTKKKRSAASLKPGVSTDRVINTLLSELRVGAGNVVTALKNGAGFDEALKVGVNFGGNVAENLAKTFAANGQEFSLQDGQVQVLKAGKMLGVVATFLSPATGLEGAPEVTNKGEVTCRARLMPGLSPGHPVELAPSVTKLDRMAMDDLGLGDLDLTPRGKVYGVLKVRYVGDLFGPDWNAELTLKEITQ